MGIAKWEDEGKQRYDVCYFQPISPDTTEAVPLGS